MMQTKGVAAERIKPSRGKTAQSRVDREIGSQ